MKGIAMMLTNSSRVRRTLLTAVLAPMFVLSAACGDDDDDAAAPTSPPVINPMPMSPPANPAQKDIVDTAVAAGSFTKLVAAVQAAGLVETLKGPGPFTVFAPTDQAFNALPAGTVEELLKPENRDKLRGILTYHVVSGKVMAADVVKLTSARTVQGQDVKIAVEGQTVRVNTARVVTADVGASNGVIHVIDTVLLPQ